MNIYQFLKKYKIYIPTPIIYSVVSGSYSIEYPNKGDVTTESTFTASLLSSIPGDITIYPSSSNSDGVFSPASITLNNSSPTQNFYYTPSVWGARSISYTNDLGVENPPSHNFVSRIQCGSIGNPVHTGAISVNLGGFSILTGSSLWLREFARIISGEPVSPQSEGIINKLTQGNYKLSFVAGATWKGVNSNYTNPFNVVSGNTEFYPLQTISYPNIFNPTGMPFIQGLAQQTWPPTYRCISGMYQGYVHVTGSHTSKFLDLKSGDTLMFWCNGFGYPIFADPNVYTVQSVLTDSVLVLETPYVGPNHEFPIVQGPYNRAATYEESFSSDAHFLVYLRNEETGGADLYETYDIKTSGNTLRCSSSVLYLYDETLSPPNRIGSTTAAGVPMTPLILNYEEAANDTINHCLGMTLTNYGGILQNSCVWPGIALAAGLPRTGVPYGGRFRLRKDWYDANVGSFSQINKNILRSMRDYGLMVTDGGTMLQVWIAGDDRWNPADFAALRTIPASALEVPISADAPQWSISGPESGACNVLAGPWTWNYLIDDNINSPAGNWYLRASLDPTMAGYTQTGPVFAQTASGHGPYTYNWTPTQSGLYYFQLTSFGQNGYWNGPPSVSGVSLAQFTFLSY